MNIMIDSWDWLMVGIWCYLDSGVTSSRWQPPCPGYFGFVFVEWQKVGDTSSVFIYNLITDVENVRTRTDQLVFPLSLCIKERSFSASVPLIPIPLPVLLHLSFLSLEGGGVTVQSVFDPETRKSPPSQMQREPSRLQWCWSVQTVALRV